MLARSSSSSRRLRIAVLAATCLASTTALAAPFRLTSPAVDTFDDWPSAVPAGTGFELAWQHYDTKTGNSSILARKFAHDGKVVGAEQTIVAPSVLVGRPRLLPAYAGKFGIVWGDPAVGVRGRTIDAATGALSAPGTLSKTTTVFFDPARLTTGQVALSHTAYDLSNTSNIRNKVALTQGSAAFAVIAKDRFVTGSDNPLISSASFDHTVVGLPGGGSLNLYRDRPTNSLQVVKASASAVMAPTRVKVNTTTMRGTSASEMAFFRVQAVRLTDGRYAVAWTSPEAAGLFNQSLRLRFLDATGKPVGTDQKVNATATGGQFDPRLLALRGGKLAVAWTQDEGITRYHRIRWYGADAKPIGAPKQLRTDTEVVDNAGSQLALMSDGRVLQVWRAKTAGYPRYSVWGEFLTPP